MEFISGRALKMSNRRSEWRFGDKSLLVILYITIFILKCNCHTLDTQTSHTETITKTVNNVDVNVDSKPCHSCQTSTNKSIDVEKEISNVDSKKDETLEEAYTLLQKTLDNIESFMDMIIKSDQLHNKTETQLENKMENVIDKVLSNRIDRIEIIDGVEIKPIEGDDKKKLQAKRDVEESRALFSKYTYEYRLLQKIKNFVETHVLSINIPKAAKFMGFRCKYF